MFRHLLERLSDYRRRQRAYAELYALDDRSLADIGITRSEIPFLLSRPAGFTDDHTRQQHRFKSYRAA
jgi:uncharacterized protein YjiS (DUF1127 family)